MSKSIQTWQRFITKRGASFVGGDIEHNEDPEGIFRGPITSIQVEGDKLVIRVEWSAHLEGDTWRKCTAPEIPHPEVFRYDLAEIDGHALTSAPQDISNGRVTFTYPFACIILHPRGGCRLYPSRVIGL